MTITSPEAASPPPLGNLPAPTTGRKEAAMWVVCIALVVLTLVPVLPISFLWLRLKEVEAVEPSAFLKMILTITLGLQDDFSKVNALLLPIFALAAGIQARSGQQSLFFMTLISISLVGAIASLFADWFIVSDAGQSLLKKPSWIGGADQEFTSWKPQAHSFY